jgi:hypothetical protein
LAAHRRTLGRVISVALAQRLRDAGLRWDPESGDRFMLPGLDMDDEVFVLSNMVVDVHDFPGGRFLGFNGTVEWALDSVQQERALWLPNEAQLRERLGGTFVRLERDGDTYEVVLDVAGHEVQVRDVTAAEAYGLALLHLATGEPVTSVASGRSS